MSSLSLHAPLARPGHDALRALDCLLAHTCALVRDLARAPGSGASADRADPAIQAVREAAHTLGGAAARAGLSPDALLARLEDGVHAFLGASGPDGAAADAAVVFVWGSARDAYHAARGALDARARGPRAPHGSGTRAAPMRGTSVLDDAPRTPAGADGA